MSAQARVLRHIWTSTHSFPERWNRREEINDERQHDILYADQCLGWEEDDVHEVYYWSVGVLLTVDVSQQWCHNKIALIWWRIFKIFNFDPAGDGPACYNIHFKQVKQSKHCWFKSSGGGGEGDESVEIRNKCQSSYELFYIQHFLRFHRNRISRLHHEAVQWLKLRSRHFHRCTHCCSSQPASNFSAE